MGRSGAASASCTPVLVFTHKLQPLLPPLGFPQPLLQGHSQALSWPAEGAPASPEAGQVPLAFGFLGWGQPSACLQPSLGGLFSSSAECLGTRRGDGEAAAAG